MVNEIVQRCEEEVDDERAHVEKQPGDADTSQKGHGTLARINTIDEMIRQHLDEVARVKVL